MPVLEGIYDIGNMLAVCRTTEALGIGCASIVSSKGLSFKASGERREARSSGNTSNSSRRPSRRFARRKRRIPHSHDGVRGAYPLSHYDWTIPTAVVFGNEREASPKRPRR